MKTLGFVICDGQKLLSDDLTFSLHLIDYEVLDAGEGEKKGKKSRDEDDDLVDEEDEDEEDEASEDEEDDPNTKGKKSKDDNGGFGDDVDGIAVFDTEAMASSHLQKLRRLLDTTCYSGEELKQFQSFLLKAQVKPLALNIRTKPQIEI